MSKQQKFQIGDDVVYPSHGIGQITAIESQEISGYSIECYVVSFEADRIKLQIPVNKTNSSGLRKPTTVVKMQEVLATLKNKLKSKKGEMWSRRAQAYEGKINSGDLISIAEVIRELYRSNGQPEQSFSERRIYQSAIDRLAQELAIVENINQTQATDRVSLELEQAA